jgi:signal transduction histidine kinase
MAVNVALMGSLARRMLVTSDAERKRLERTLHDGAQQRLVATATTLGLALRRLKAGEEGAAELVEEASAELALCVEDLRALAREIFPVVLAERGLASGLNDLAQRAAVVVEVLEVPEGRLPEAVELAAYLVVEEALRGAEGGGEVSVSGSAAGSELVVEVRGAGVADEQLARLRDRVEALDGSIEGGPGGSGGSVRAVFPID